VSPRLGVAGRNTGVELEEVITTGVEAHVVSTEHTIEHGRLWNIGGVSVNRYL
jgi:hypothetical protein